MFIKKFFTSCVNIGMARNGYLKLTKGLYNIIVNHKGKIHGKQSLIPCIKHDDHYFKFCILRSVVLTQFRSLYVRRPVSGFVQVQQGRRDRTRLHRQKQLFSFQNEHFLYFLTNIQLRTTKSILV